MTARLATMEAVSQETIVRPSGAHSIQSSSSGKELLVVEGEEGTSNITKVSR